MTSRGRPWGIRRAVYVADSHQYKDGKIRRALDKNIFSTDYSRLGSGRLPDITLLIFCITVNYNNLE